MEWLHLYNTVGPEALAYQRTVPAPSARTSRPALVKRVRAAQRSAAAPPVAGADPAPRWTLRRLVGWVRQRFGRTCCRETIRAALQRLSAVLEEVKPLGRPTWSAARPSSSRSRTAAGCRACTADRLVHLDEARIDQDADLGYGWADRGQAPLWVALALAASVGQALVLRPLSLQRRPSAALALCPRQRRAHHRCPAPLRPNGPRIS